MNTQKHPNWSRREFLQGVALAGGAGLLSLQSTPASAEPPPETTTIRVLFDPDVPVLCFAPQYVAEQFLGMEGFTDVQYVPNSPDTRAAPVTVAANGTDITAGVIPGLLPQLDAEKPIVILGGLHAGCYELFARKEIRTIRELKHKRVAIASFRGVGFNLLASMVTLIGFDIEQDIEWVKSSPEDWTDMLEQGQVDAILTFPPMSYAVRDKNIGHVILNTIIDEPWRHYFCCMVAAHREFTQNYPIATKRALRAILKANLLCSLEPERTARWLVDEGYTTHYDYAVQTLQDVNYAAWRDYDPEDSLRFYSLRLREAGIIKSTPQQIIARGTDWRFINELKRELKA